MIFWLSILATVASSPLIGAIGFAGVVTILVLVFQWFGWVWGLGALTLMGLVSGPALLLTPIILIITVVAWFRGPRSSNAKATAGRIGSDATAGRIPGSETTTAPRPILPEPRSADRSR